MLLHDAELDIEDDECNDEDAESTAYAEVRKRLEMTPEQLREDFERLTEWDLFSAFSAQQKNLALIAQGLFVDNYQREH